MDATHSRPTCIHRERGGAGAGGCGCGMEEAVAGGKDVHTNLLARGHRRVQGNRYPAPSGDDTPLAVDLLVPLTAGGRIDAVYVGEYGFDAIPG